jgi:hypothetical protein
LILLNKILPWVAGPPTCAQGHPINNGNEESGTKIEVERLFNVGMNLGVTSNKDRITMIGKLVELEGINTIPSVHLLEMNRRTYDYVPAHLI